MLILELLILLPFFFGLYVGISAIVRPAGRPNFEFVFKKRYPRREWNERNPETFTQRIGTAVLIGALLYGTAVLLPWVLR